MEKEERGYKIEQEEISAGRAMREKAESYDL
jgi:hypothetical protein